MGLTARDIEIIRAADTITFQGDGSTHQMIARLNYQNLHNTTGRDQDHAIPVFGYVVKFGLSEAKEATATLVANARVSAMVSASPLTKTWASLLRPRDEPVLVWWADNTSEELRQMDLASDELHLAIFRNHRERSRFHVAVRVTAAESTGRMIRIEA